MESAIRVISTKAFYGKTKLENTESSKKENKNFRYEPVPFKLQRLLGPTSVWKVYKRQAEALSFVNSKKCGLMPFVFQQSSGERLFLAAHPSWLWHYDSQKDSSTRCSYEIIPEFTVCKLYLDLEFERICNPSHNGAEMVDTLVCILIYFIKHTWNLQCSRKNVIDLDSSTDYKFSRHLIFFIDNAVFRDNYNVGNFVKFVCKEIMNSIEHKNDLTQKCGVSTESVQMLKIRNSKGKLGLFCDLGVYTKNRHFRLFKSTKPRKNAPLLLSKENQYMVNTQCGNSSEEQIFLDSLITYIPGSIDMLRILHYGNTEEGKDKSRKSNSSYPESNIRSPFPKIDDFVQGLIVPGRIWRNFYFQTSETIMYDVIGYRFCGNIGREHRSNNIKIIVDIGSRTYYQKCYDPECSTYRSESVLLPPEIQFYLEDDADFCDIYENDCEFETSLDISEQELAEIASVVEEISVTCE